MKKLSLSVAMLLSSVSANAWEANVTDILQHGDVAAITLSPDPGKGNCSYGSPYILIVDGSPASEQRFSMLLTALTTGKKVRGYTDACSTAIWGQSRPTIRRLGLTNED